ncbi:GIY-YIG nuclease family protein [Treponema sp. R6D11]
MLRCSDNSLYTGWTNDIENRVAQHNLGHASKYTRTRLPVSLVYFELFADRNDAMKRECEIKKLSKQEKEKLVEAMAS